MTALSSRDSDVAQERRRRMVLAGEMTLDEALRELVQEMTDPAIYGVRYMTAGGERINPEDVRPA